MLEISLKEITRGSITAQLPETGTLVASFAQDRQRSATYVNPLAESEYVRELDTSMKEDPAILGWNLQEVNYPVIEVGWKGLPTSSLRPGITIEPLKEKSSGRTLMLVGVSTPKGSSSIIRYTNLTPAELFSIPKDFSGYLHGDKPSKEPGDGGYVNLNMENYQPLLGYAALDSEVQSANIEDLIRRWSGVKHLIRNQVASMNTQRYLLGPSPVCVYPINALNIAYNFEAHMHALRLTKAVLGRKTMGILEGLASIQSAANHEHIEAYYEDGIEEREEESELMMHVFEAQWNAFKRAAAKRVIVEARRHQIQGMLRIKIHDDGKGIMPGILNDIFTPGFTTSEDGSGQGMSLMAEYIRARKGILRVRTFSKEQGFSQERIIDPSGGSLQQPISMDYAVSTWPDRQSGTTLEFYLPQK